MATSVEESSISSANIVAEAVEAASAAMDATDQRILTLSTGVKLKLRPVPPIAIREAALLKPQPSVPMYFNKDREREEPNPNDPDYLAALNTYAIEQLYRMTDTLLLLGTKPLSLPDDVYPVESDEWVEELNTLGIYFDVENRSKRYLSWLRLHAVRTEVDIAQILGRVTVLSGVTEVEVQRAAAAFQHHP